MNPLLIEFSEIIGPEEIELFRQALEFIIPNIPAILALVTTYIIEGILINKKIILHRWEKKVQKAKELGQVVTAKLTGSKNEHAYDDYVTAKYVYSIDGIHKRSKIIGRKAFEGEWVRWPDKILIYYLGNRIYTDYDTKDPLGTIICTILPWIIGCIVMALTRPELIH